jgi:uncharacterized protein DUF2804
MPEPARRITGRAAAGAAPPEGRALSLRPRKAWRYAGVFGPELMLCAGVVRIGPAPQAFWAVWDRTHGVLRERTSLRPTRAVALPDGALRIRAPGVEVDLRLEADGEPVAVTSPHGRHAIWTRKLPVRAVGTVRLDGVARAVDARGLVDDSAGRHARETAWRWAAGVGRAPDGHALTWNLVDGIHDDLGASERTVWVDGAAAHRRPVRFSGDLSRLSFREGGELAFRAEAVRERHDRLGPVSSDYVQPFGTAAGSLGAGIELAEGYGVMERHVARW